MPKFWPVKNLQQYSPQDTGHPYGERRDSMEWQEQAAHLKFDKGVSWANLPTELEKICGEKFSKEQIRSRLRDHPQYKRSQIQYEDKKEYTTQDVTHFINSMMSLQEAHIKLNTKQVKASIRIHDDKPIGVAYWGDWHIGAAGVDYRLFDEDLNKIRDTEGLYFIGAGDYKDNVLTGGHPGAQYEQVIQPGMQDIAVFHYVEQVAEKCLVLLQGCHDSWDNKTANKDFVASLCEKVDAVNFWHGGELHLKVGEEEYLWRCRHKYKFQSSLNVENAMRRISEMQGPCDVAAEAHLHNPYTMMRHLMGQYRIMLRSGSYKIWDEFGQKLAGYKGKPGVPVVILFPGTHKMIPITHLDDAIDVLRGLRA